MSDDLYKFMAGFSFIAVVLTRLRLWFLAKRVEKLEHVAAEQEEG